MSQGLIRRLTVQSQYEEALVKINATAAERLAALKSKPQASIQRDMLSICSDPFTVAQQLTHIELVRNTLNPHHAGRNGWIQLGGQPTDGILLFLFPSTGENQLHRP